MTGRWGEVRDAEWTEIDAAGRAWTVPATRMKMKREHQGDVLAGIDLEE